MSKHTTPDGFPVDDYQVSAPPHPSKHLRGFVPSEVWPHIDALQTAGIYDRLSEDDQGLIIKLMQAAYRRGKADAGAEKIDVDAVWVDGIGGIERQSDGTWALSMPDKSDASIAAAVLGSKGGSATSEAKTKAARTNAKKGGWPKGRPRKVTK